MALKGDGRWHSRNNVSAVIIASARDPPTKLLAFRVSYFQTVKIGP